MKKSVLLSLFSGVLLFMANNSAVGTEENGEINPNLDIGLPKDTKIVANEINKFSENEINEQTKHTKKKTKKKAIKEEKNFEEDSDEKESGPKSHKTIPGKKNIKDEGDFYENIKKGIDEACGELIEATQALVKAGIISSAQMDKLIDALSAKDEENAGSGSGEE